jgi:hypothetical protein
MNKIMSFNCRTFSLPNYTAPLYVHTLDIDASIADLELPDFLKQISSTSNHHVVTINKWLRVSYLVVEILKNDNLWARLAKTNPYRKAELNSTWSTFRQRTVNKMEQIQNDKTQLAYLMALNSVYRASEGDVPLVDYPSSSLSIEWFMNTLQGELLRKIDTERDIPISIDDVVAWFRVFSLIITKPTPNFKKYFNDLLGYEIPYGLSPETKSTSLETLIKNSKTIAVVPMLSGINSISTALANGNWVIAIQAAASTGAVVIIVLSSLALSDKIIEWLNRREAKTEKKPAS